MPSEASAGHAALEAGRWEEARSAFEASLAVGETPAACLGLADRAVVARRQPRQRRSRDAGVCPVPPGRRRRGRCPVRGVARHHLQGELRQLLRSQRLDRAGRAADRAPSAGCHAWLDPRRSRLPDGRPRWRRSADQPGHRARSRCGRRRSGARRPLPVGADPRGPGTPGRRLRPDRRGDGGGPRGGAVQPGHGRLHVLRHAQRVRAGERHRAGRAVVPCRRRLRRQLRLPIPLRRVPHLLRERAGGDGKMGRSRPRADRRRGDHQGCLPWPARQGVDPPRRVAGAAGPARGLRAAVVHRRRSTPRPRPRSPTPPCSSPGATPTRRAASWNNDCTTSPSTAPISPRRSTC